MGRRRTADDTNTARQQQLQAASLLRRYFAEVVVSEEQEDVRRGAVVIDKVNPLNVQACHDVIGWAKTMMASVRVSPKHLQRTGTDYSGRIGYRQRCKPTGETNRLVDLVQGLVRFPMGSRAREPGSSSSRRRRLLHQPLQEPIEKSWQLLAEAHRQLSNCPITRAVAHPFCQGNMKNPFPSRM